MICIYCGKEEKSYLCDGCKVVLDVRALSERVINYKRDEGDTILDKVQESIVYPITLRTIVKDIIEELVVSPMKEELVYKVSKGFTNRYSGDMNSLEMLISNYQLAEDMNEEVLIEMKVDLLGICLTKFELNRAEELLSEVRGFELSKLCNYILSDYYIKTRRYKEALIHAEKCKEQEGALFGVDIEEFIQVDIYNRDPNSVNKTARKIEYLPAKKDNKIKYLEFLKSIGVLDEDFDVVFHTTPKPKAPKPDFMRNKVSMAKTELPPIEEVRHNNFRTFVAFDIETTGFSHDGDEIIELSAIRVVDGILVRGKEFEFSELVKPKYNKISTRIKDLTGITNDMVSDAPHIEPVIDAFIKFVGDDILLGHNAAAFDSRFIRKAALDRGVVMNNKYFDTLKAIRSDKKFEFDSYKLGNIGSAIGVANDNAHRALSDAVATAEIYLKLLCPEE